VDIEYKNLSQAKLNTIPRIVKRYFHPTEQHFFSDLDEVNQAQYFYPLWTLKEAFLKATGAGIANGLHRYLFKTLAENPTWPQVMDTDSDKTDITLNIRWLGASYNITSDYVLSVSSRMNTATPLSSDTVKIFRLSPGCHDPEIQSDFSQAPILQAPCL
jgi:phosphopantetheine--protein transferase-like protein